MRRRRRDEEEEERGDVWVSQLRVLERCGIFKVPFRLDEKFFVYNKRVFLNVNLKTFGKVFDNCFMSLFYYRLLKCRIQNRSYVKLQIFEAIFIQLDDGDSIGR